MIEYEETRWTVQWSMGFDAANPCDAVLQAIGTHRDPESLATVFFVVDHHDDDREYQLDAALIEGFVEWTQLDIEDVMFFPAFTEWMGPGVMTPAHDLAEWWADNQGRFV